MPKGNVNWFFGEFCMSKFFNQIQISKLFRADYIFDITPKTTGLYQYLGIGFVLLGLIALVLWWLNRKKPKLKKEFFGKIIALFTTTALLGLVLLFFRMQEIPYLASRLMMLSLLLMFVIWGGFIIYYRFRVLPKEFKKTKEKENFERYLPKKIPRKENKK